MKNLLITFLIAFPVIILTGCLKITTTINVNKDGSGTIEETVLISREVADMLAEFSAYSDDTTGSKEFLSMFNEEDLINSSSNYGEGVEYVSGEKISNDLWEGYKAKYSYSRLDNIKLKPDPDSKITFEETDEELSTSEGDHYYFKFIDGEIPQVVIDRPDFDAKLDDEEVWEEQTEDESVEMDEQFIQMMEGMTIDIAMQFEGEIVETNAGYVDGSKVTLIGIDLGKLLKDKENLDLFKRKQPKTIDELKEMVEKVPGMKLELQKPVIINFK